MNRILTVPNWSFYDPGLCAEAHNLLSNHSVQIHYDQGDVDHQRTVIAFSGQQDVVFRAMDALTDFLLPEINLETQHGVHPRVGALDVAPFVLLEGYEYDLIEETRQWGASLAQHYHLPVRLYEKAAKPGNEYRLPYLRGQKGAINQDPDFGSQGPSKWGTTIVGVRDFLLATNINLGTADLSVAKLVARAVRDRRESGDEEFSGVRALGFALKSRNMVQVSLNFTEPTITAFDTIYDFVKSLVEERDAPISETELIGVIRERDLVGATQLSYDPSQVVR